MPFNTALTRKLNIRVPVVQGGMQWVGYAELASAVSNAGGLGLLTALTQPTPQDLDFLSIDGIECAGHVGEHDITNFILLSRARQDLGVPFIASGGFADGFGLAAALSLGAQGINMGTRFMSTVEAPIHQNIKEAIVKGQETDTALVLRRWKNTSRLFSNKVTQQALKLEKESKTGDFGEISPYVNGQRTRQVYLNGDPEHGVWYAGQVMGLIHDIPTCQVLLTRIEREALEAMNRIQSLHVELSTSRL